MKRQEPIRCMHCGDQGHLMTQCQLHKASLEELRAGITFRYNKAVHEAREAIKSWAKTFSVTEATAREQLKRTVGKA